MLRHIVNRARTRAVLLLAVGVIAAALALSLEAEGALRRLEFESVDARIAIRGGSAAPPDIVVVGIDPATMSDLHLRFPFPRSVHAQVIDRLTAYGARVIAYDVEFRGPTLRREDTAMLNAVARSGRVVLASSRIERDGRPQVIGGASSLERHHGDIGLDTAWAEDPGGEVRRMRPMVAGVPSFAVQAARRFQRGRVVAAANAPGARWIDFRGPRGTFRSYSFSKVPLGRVPASAFRGRIVIVGATDPALHDVLSVPPSGKLMTGAELQANAIDTTLRGFPLSQVSPLIDYAIAAVLALGIALIAIVWSGLTALVVAVVLGGLYAVAAQVAFNAGDIVAFVYPMLAVVVSTAGSGAVDYFTEVRERRRMRGVFARFVPEQVVDEVLDRTDDDLRLGGAAIDASVLFCDLRGFTTFSERTPPERVIAILNRYLTEVSEAIRAHGGTLVTFLGDGVMAVFGAPIERPDHADTALAAGREILEVRLPAFNQWLTEQGEAAFGLGIGIASGTVMSGNVGADWRVEYTVIGDTSNVAARLQAATKGTAHQLLMSDATRARLSDQDAVVAAGSLELRGRLERVTTWAPAPRDRTGGP